VNCAGGNACRRRADVVVDCGEGLLALLCGRCAVLGVAACGWRILRVLVGDEPVTARPRGA
jgi:hypothetical protein